MSVGMYWKGDIGSPAGEAVFVVGEHSLTTRFDTFVEAHRVYELAKAAERQARREARAELLQQINSLEAK